MCCFEVLCSIEGVTECDDSVVWSYSIIKVRRLVEELDAAAICATAECLEENMRTQRQLGVRGVYGRVTTSGDVQNHSTGRLGHRTTCIL